MAKERPEDGQQIATPPFLSEVFGKNDDVVVRINAKRTTISIIYPKSEVADENLATERALRQHFNAAEGSGHSSLIITSAGPNNRFHIDTNTYTKKCGDAALEPVLVIA